MKERTAKESRTAVIFEMAADSIFKVWLPFHHFEKEGVPVLAGQTSMSCTLSLFTLEDVL